MHFTSTEVIAALLSAYAALHGLISVIAPKLPKPEAMGNKFYPAFYAAMNWIALGNGPKPPAEPPTPIDQK